MRHLTLPFLMLMLGACSADPTPRTDDEGIQAPSTLQTPPIDLALVERLSNESGLTTTRSQDGEHLVTTCSDAGIDVQIDIYYLPKVPLVYLETSNYLNLSMARNDDAVVLLLTQIAVANYETLIGKFQLNPESGDIVISAEIELGETLSSRVLTSTWQRLCKAAVVWHPTLSTAADVGAL